MSTQVKLAPWMDYFVLIAHHEGLGFDLWRKLELSRMKERVSGRKFQLVKRSLRSLEKGPGRTRCDITYSPRWDSWSATCSPKMSKEPGVHGALVWASLDVLGADVVEAGCLEFGIWGQPKSHDDVRVEILEDRRRIVPEEVQSYRLLGLDVPYVWPEPAFIKWAEEMGKLG